jgi:hypothetical protein
MRKRNPLSRKPRDGRKPSFRRKSVGLNVGRKYFQRKTPDFFRVFVPYAADAISASPGADCVMSTIAAILAALPESERRKALASLPAADLAALDRARPVPAPKQRETRLRAAGASRSAS